MNTQSSEGFVWNDTVVKEFYKYCYNNVFKQPTYPEEMINNFKNTYTSKDNLVSGSNVAMVGKDWEIVSYKNNDMTWNLYQGKYYNVFSGYTESVPQNASIYSVRRVSDGVVFSIGDETNYGIIEKFFIGWAGMEVHVTNGCGATLASIEKNKKPEALFKDFLGNDVFEDDRFSAVQKGTFNLLPDCSYPLGTPENWIVFKNDLDARKYISEHNPQFSIKDFKDILIRYDYAIDMMEDVFTDLKYLGKLNDKK